MMYDNGILSSLKKVSKPLTLKEALFRWGNDPVWHKLVADGCIQCYSHAVTVSNSADKWLNERKTHHWLLEQKLKDAKNEADCYKIYKCAKKELFLEISRSAHSKIWCIFQVEDTFQILEETDVLEDFDDNDLWSDSQYVEGVMSFT
jgi:hypothetical protein